MGCPAKKRCRYHYFLCCPERKRMDQQRCTLKLILMEDQAKDNLLRPDVKNALYPVFLKLEKLNILLVGGGNVGLEKLTSLLSNSPAAKVTIVAPLIKEELRSLAADHPFCSIVQREFDPEDLDEKDIAILATDNRLLHEQIRVLATEKNVLLNVADTPELCDFYLGSIVQKGDLKIAISTNGKSPTLAKRLREMLTEIIPEGMQTLLDNLKVVRDNLKGDFEYKVNKLNEITTLIKQVDSATDDKKKS